MSFSIVDSKIKNYTRPIYEVIINQEQKEQQVVLQPQTVVQEQKVQSEPVINHQDTPQPVQNQPFILEKRKPFQLKSRERFQARRISQPPVLPSQLENPTPPVVVQAPPPPVVQPPAPVPLVQLPTLTQAPPVENQEQSDEFGYSIDDI